MSRNRSIGKCERPNRAAPKQITTAQTGNKAVVGMRSAGGWCIPRHWPPGKHPDEQPNAPGLIHRHHQYHHSRTCSRFGRRRGRRLHLVLVLRCLVRAQVHKAPCDTAQSGVTANVTDIRRCRSLLLLTRLRSICQCSAVLCSPPPINCLVTGSSVARARGASFTRAMASSCRLVSPWPGKRYAISAGCPNFRSSFDTILRSSAPRFLPLRPEAVLPMTQYACRAERLQPGQGFEKILRITQA